MKVLCNFLNCKWFIKFIQTINISLGKQNPYKSKYLVQLYHLSTGFLTSLVHQIQNFLNFFHTENLCFLTKNEIWKYVFRNLFVSKIYYFQSISPGMVDTDLLRIYDSTLIEHLPKLNVADVTAAVLYALATADYVQVSKLLQCSNIWLSLKMAIASICFSDFVLVSQKSFGHTKKTKTFVFNFVFRISTGKKLCYL